MNRSRRRPGICSHMECCGSCWRVIRPEEVAGYDRPDSLDAPGAPRVRLAFCVECAVGLDYRRGPRGVS